MKDPARVELGRHRGYLLTAIQDGTVRGYAVPDGSNGNSSAFAISGVSLEAVERRLRQIIDAELAEAEPSRC